VSSGASELYSLNPPKARHPGEGAGLNEDTVVEEHSLGAPSDLPPPSAVSAASPVHPGQGEAQAPFCLYLILFHLFISLFMYLFPGDAHINMMFPEVTRGDSTRRHQAGTQTRGHVLRHDAALEQAQRQDLQSDI